MRLIANPPPQKSNLTWVGPYTVPLNTVISQRDEIYKQLFVSFIPVVDQTYFGNYSLQYRESIICTIKIIAEGSEYLFKMIMQDTYNEIIQICSVSVFR